MTSTATIRKALKKTMHYAPVYIAEFITTFGQATFENDNTELIGDLAHELAGSAGITLDEAITLVSEDLPISAGYALYNRHNGTNIQYGC